VPPTPRARTIQVYLYKYTSVRRSSPGKLCVGSPLGMCVLDHPWETMSWITRISPGKLCVVSFGPQLLGPQPWFTVLGRQGPWPLGPVCVASPLEYYVLHQSLETNNLDTMSPESVLLCTIMLAPVRGKSKGLQKLCNIAQHSAPSGAQEVPRPPQMHNLGTFWLHLAPFRRHLGTISPESVLLCTIMLAPVRGKCKGLQKLCNIAQCSAPASPLGNDELYDPSSSSSSS